MATLPSMHVVPPLDYSHHNWQQFTSGATETRTFALQSRLELAGTTIPGPVAQKEGVAWDGSHFWVCSGNRLRKLDPSDGTVLEHFISPAGTSFRDITFDGTNLWIAETSTDEIREIDRSDGSTVSSFSSPSTVPLGLAWDGTNLRLYDFGTDLLYTINRSGTVQSSFTPAFEYDYLDWKDSQLWGRRSTDGRVDLINTSDGTVTSTWESPRENAGGIVWRSTLWHQGGTNAGVYTVSELTFKPIVPIDFVTMTTLTWTSNHWANGQVDDTLAYAVRIMNGSTVLAAADSGGTFAFIENVTSTSLANTVGPTAFAYVNTSASKATWEGASVELRQTYSTSMSNDNASIVAMRVEFGGTYEQGGVTLVVADAAHGHAADNITLAFRANAADASHGHSSDSPTLTQAHTLAVDDASHGHAADNVTLVISGDELVVAAATHGHTAESVTLVEEKTLAVNGASHAHSVDSPTLDRTITAVPNDATHGHAADKPQLLLTHDTFDGWLVDGNGIVGPRNWLTQNYQDIAEPVDLDIPDSSFILAPTNANGVDTSFTLVDVPTDFDNMTGVHCQVACSTENLDGDDTYTLSVRIMAGSTVLAAGSSAGAFQIIDSDVRHPRELREITFTYVNQAAAKSVWNSAEIELRAGHSATMSADSNRIRVYAIELTGTYDLVSNPPDTPVITAPADQAALSETVSLEAHAVDPEGDNVYLRWEVWEPIPVKGEVDRSLTPLKYPNSGNIYPLGIDHDGENIWSVSNNTETDLSDGVINFEDLDRVFEQNDTTGAEIEEYRAGSTEIRGVAFERRGGSGAIVWVAAANFNEIWRTRTSSTFIGGPFLDEFAEYSLSGVTDLVYADGDVWVVRFGNLNKADLVNGGADDIPGGQPDINVSGVTWDGTHLWAGENDGGFVALHRVHPVTGAIVESFVTDRVFPTTGGIYIGYDPAGFIWISGGGGAASSATSTLDRVPVWDYYYREDITENTTPVASGATHTTSWDTTTVDPGSYELRVWAVDAFGLESHEYASIEVTVSQHATLVVGDATHEHKAKNIILPGDNIAISERNVHSHTANSPTLIQAQMVVAHNTSHSHAADALAFVYVEPLGQAGSAKVGSNPCGQPRCEDPVQIRVSQPDSTRAVSAGDHQTATLSHTNHPCPVFVPDRRTITTTYSDGLSDTVVVSGPLRWDNEPDGIGEFQPSWQKGQRAGYLDDVWIEKFGGQPDRYGNIPNTWFDQNYGHVSVIADGYAIVTYERQDNPADRTGTMYAALVQLCGDGLRTLTYDHPVSGFGQIEERINPDNDAPLHSIQLNDTDVVVAFNRSLLDPDGDDVIEVRPVVAVVRRDETSLETFGPVELDPAGEFYEIFTTEDLRIHDLSALSPTRFIASFNRLDETFADETPTVVAVDFVDGSFTVGPTHDVAPPAYLEFGLAIAPVSPNRFVGANSSTESLNPPGGRTLYARSFDVDDNLNITEQAGLDIDSFVYSFYSTSRIFRLAEHDYMIFYPRGAEIMDRPHRLLPNPTPAFMDNDLYHEAVQDPDNWTTTPARHQGQVPGSTSHVSELPAVMRFRIDSTGAIVKSWLPHVLDATLRSVSILVGSDRRTNPTTITNLGGCLAFTEAAVVSWNAFKWGTDRPDQPLGWARNDQHVAAVVRLDDDSPSGLTTDGFRGLGYYPGSFGLHPHFDPAWFPGTDWVVGVGSNFDDGTYPLFDADVDADADPNSEPPRTLFDTYMTNAGETILHRPPGHGHNVDYSDIGRHGITGVHEAAPGQGEAFEAFAWQDAHDLQIPIWRICEPRKATKAHKPEVTVRRSTDGEIL